MVKRIAVKDTEGKTRYRLVPETDEERRELQRQPATAQGGIDKRDDAGEGDDTFDDE